LAEYEYTIRPTIRLEENIRYNPNPNNLDNNVLKFTICKHINKFC